MATRDPAECIRVQLAALPSDTGGRDLALRIARDYLDLVAQHDLDELARQTGAGEQPLQTALELIQSLEPRPGARYDNRRDEYLVPDVYVTRADDSWRVTLNPENEPGLRLNRYYIDLLRKSGGKDAEYLQGRLQEARWLMSSLELRNQTLLRVSQAIVDLDLEGQQRVHVDLGRHEHRHPIGGRGQGDLRDPGRLGPADGQRIPVGVGAARAVGTSTGEAECDDGGDGGYDDPHEYLHGWSTRRAVRAWC